MRRPIAPLLPFFAALSLLFVLSAAVRADFDEDHREPINGTTLHFRVRGADKANPYLLLLHGGPGFSSHMFLPWGKTSGIEKRLNVVYLDQRGSGESAPLKIADLEHPKPDEVKGYTVPTLVEDIEGVRRALKVEKWYVLGHSWGGVLGIEYAAAHPESILGYVHMDGLLSQPAAQDALLDYAARFYAGKDTEAAKKRRPEVARLRKMPAGPARLTGAFALLFSDPGLFSTAYYAKGVNAFSYQAKIAAEMRAYGTPLTVLSSDAPAAALLVTEKYATREVTPLLAKLRGFPTLVLNGRQDRLITPEQAERVHRGVVGSRLLLLDDCGHFPFAEQPEKTAQAVLDLVSATGTVGGG
jgi:proline iminopeptidase